MDATGNGYLTVKFSEPVIADVNDSITGVTLNGTLLTSGAEPTVASVSTDKKSVVLKFATPAKSYQTVEFAAGAFKDLATNPSKKFSGSVTFKVTAPTVASYAYSVSKDVETVTFDRAVAFATGTTTPVKLAGKKVVDNVETLYTTTTGLPASINAKGEVELDTTGFGKGNYTLTIPAGTLVDAVGQTNTKDIVLTFTLDKAGVAAQTVVSGFASDAQGTLPSTAITAPVQADGYVYVKYSTEVDASAVNVANYTVEGQEVFSNAVFTSTDKDVVKLTLKANTIAKDGDYTVDVKNVVDAAGKAVKAFTGEFTFNDNTAPKLTALQFVSNLDVATSTDTIVKATFSEEIADLDTATLKDFKVTVNGIETPVTAVTQGTGVNANTVEISFAKALQSNDVVVVTIDDDATELTDASADANPIAEGQSKSITIK